MNPSDKGDSQSAQNRRRGVTVKHGISGSNKYVIKKLEQKLRSRTARLTEAERVNTVLLAKEKVLLENVAAQGETLHFVALAAFQEPDAADGADAAMTSMAQSLLHDVKVHELLGMVGSTSSASPQQEPYTTRCMRAAFTPKRVAAVRSMTIEHVVQQLQQMTMKLALLMQAGEAADAAMSDGDEPPPALSFTVDQVVDEYTELAMLLHVANDKVNLQLGTINLDTMQPQEPPAGHWKRVLSHLNLCPAQASHIRAGFQLYTDKVAPLVSATHELVRVIHAVTGLMPPPSSLPAGQRLQHSTAQHSTSHHSASFDPSMLSASANANNINIKIEGVQDSTSGMGLLGTRSNGIMQAGGSSRLELFGSQTPSLSPGVVCTTTAAAAAVAAAAATDPVSNSRCNNAGSPSSSGGFTAGGYGASGDGSSSSTNARPWQQFGLPQKGLTVEDAEHLEELLQALLTNIMRLRELHRGMTFLWLNALTKRQKAISIVKGYPFWTQPLSMCKHLMEEQEQQQQQLQGRPRQPVPRKA